MKPNRASANRPSASITTKKTPMIRLKKVKTFPATMLATERLVRSSTGPSLRSRFAASLLERPPGWRWSVIAALLAQRDVGPEPVCEGPRLAAPQLAASKIGELLALSRGGTPCRDAGQSRFLGAEPDRLTAAVRDQPSTAVAWIGLGKAEVPEAGVRDRVQIAVFRHPRAHQARTGVGPEVLRAVRPPLEPPVHVRARDLDRAAQVDDREGLGRVPATAALAGVAAVQRVVPARVRDAEVRPAPADRSQLRPWIPSRKSA